MDVPVAVFPAVVAVEDDGELGPRRFTSERVDDALDADVRELVELGVVHLRQVSFRQWIRARRGSSVTDEHEGSSGWAG